MIKIYGLVLFVFLQSWSSLTFAISNNIEDNFPNEINCDQALNLYEPSVSWGAKISLSEGNTLQPVSFLVAGFPIVVLVRHEYRETSCELDNKIIEQMILQGSSVLDWTMFSSHQPIFNVNCHGFTMMNSHIPFLHWGYWINSVADQTISFGFNPLKLILKSYFQTVFKIDQIHPNSLQQLFSSAYQAQEDDVLIFTNHHGFINHSGLIKFSKDGKYLQLLHKLGSGPILLSPLEHSFWAYPPAKLEIWRRRP